MRIVTPIPKIEGGAGGGGRGGKKRGEGKGEEGGLSSSLYQNPPKRQAMTQKSANPKEPKTSEYFETPF